MQKHREPLWNSLVAVGEWMLVLPATVLLMAAALRLLQPPLFEPAHTSRLISDWSMTHISRSGAAALFLGLPGITVLLGCLVVIRHWRRDPTLRQDTCRALLSLRRHFVIGAVLGATLLASGILSAVVAHLLTD